MGKKSKKYTYGKCRFCKNAIAIPGLDRYKCSNCGWRDHKKDWVWFDPTNTNYKQYK